MVPTIDVQTLSDKIADDGEDLVVLDCREPRELLAARIPGALHVPMQQIPARLGELDRSRAYAVLCHHGIRSLTVCTFLLRQGFSRVLNVSGGIAAYAREVDPAVGTY